MNARAKMTSRQLSQCLWHYHKYLHVKCNINKNIQQICSSHYSTSKETKNLEVAELDNSLADYIEKVKQHKAKGVPIVHHQNYVCDFPLQHRFCMRKFHAVMGHLRRDGVISGSQIVEPDPVPSKNLALVHDMGYIHSFLGGLTSPEEQRKTGFKWSPGIVSRCRYETGGTIQACHLAMERGLACSTGGGTHHAFAAHGSGYCLLNDMAVAAATMIDNKMAERVLIVDLDVHQGDGTASILADRPDIFTLSLHCQSNFPFAKQTSDLDIGLKDHLGDSEYMKELEDCLPWVVDSFHPDLVIFDAGVDPHIEDELGRLDLTDNGLFSRDSYVINFLMQRGIPVATVIGGGYSRSLDVLGKRHTIVHRAATKVWQERQL